MKRQTKYSLAQLAQHSGLPARTVRYYIARGLLDGPEKAGRDARYGDRHLEQLSRIQKLQSAGRTLAGIAHELTGGRAAPAAPTAWWQHEVASDVVVMVKAENRPWRLKQIREAMAEFAARVNEQGGGDDGKRD